MLQQMVQQERAVSDPLATLTETMDLGWFQTDADRNLTVWSDALERLTGFEADEVLGLPCVVAIRCAECLAGCGIRDNDEVRDIPMTLHAKDGSGIQVRKFGRALYDGTTFQGTVEGVLPEAEKPSPEGWRMDALLASLGRHWIIADSEFQLVAASSNLREELGWASGAFAGMALESLLGAEVFGPDSAFREAVADGRRPEGWRAEMRRADGSHRPVSISAGRTEGLPIRYFVMIRPTTGNGESQATFEGMVGRAASMQRIFRMVDLLRDNDATVLITGESGTGKELVARALHTRSHRRDGPFVAVNCAALPADLLESELFGHVRGAFTGAVRDRPGRFELAQGGTLFLDEIGDLPLQLQVKLLRVLQEHTFERVGDSTTRHVDVRVIAATNADLEQAVQEKRFRDDLYYRLRVVPIEVPPLRERREDLEPLIHHLLDRIGGRRGRAIRLSPSAMRAMLAFDWPGNVRQLENALEFATAVCEGQTVHERDLPPDLRRVLPDVVSPRSIAVSPRPVPAPALAPDPREAREAEQIRAALERHHYNRGNAAAALGMSRTTLWRKMKEHRIR
jgi:transcriptional regulator with PAS, ATPase and Fis domain